MFASAVGISGCFEGLFTDTESASICKSYFYIIKAAVQKLK